MSISSNVSSGGQCQPGHPEDQLARLLGRLAAQRWLRMHSDAGQQPREKANSTRQRRVTPSNAKE